MCLPTWFSQDCFILDTKTSGIYVWIGKKGTANEKTGAMKNAENFLKANKYPAWTQVCAFFLLKILHR